MPQNAARSYCPGMADVELDLHELLVLWKALSKVCDRFGYSEGVGSDLIRAVGHDGLTDRLHDFGDSWDERREDMVADLDTVWRGVKLVEEAFTELDRTLAEGLPEPVDIALQQAPAGAS